MHFFINEDSIQEQFFLKENADQAIKIIITVILKIKKSLKNDCRVMKNSMMINRSFIKNTPFHKTIGNLTKNQQRLFYHLIMNDTLDWNSGIERLHNINSRYVIESMNNKVVTKTSVAEAAEYRIGNIEETNVLVNFISSSYSKKKHVVVVKDENTSDKINLDCIEKENDIEKYIVPKKLESFVRDNSMRFTETKHNDSKCRARVFLDTQNNYYWHLDTLHKDHYEVYCKDKKHIGTSDLEGNIDVKRKKSGRVLLFSN